MGYRLVGKGSGGIVRNLGSLALVVTLAGCSNSELNNCIEDQMAVWQERSDHYNSLPEQVDDGSTVTLDGVEVPTVLMGRGVRDPGTEAEARARANLRCGKVYAR